VAAALAWQKGKLWLVLGEKIQSLYSRVVLAGG